MKNCWVAWYVFTLLISTWLLSLNAKCGDPWEFGTKIDLEGRYLKKSSFSSFTLLTLKKYLQKSFQFSAAILILSILTLNLENISLVKKGANSSFSLHTDKKNARKGQREVRSVISNIWGDSKEFFKICHKCFPSNKRGL